LLSQYKQCSVINDKQLREAKNIRELIGIQVAALDKKLYKTVGPGEISSARGDNRHTSAQPEQNYDFTFDPVKFRQKMPCLGDREFLVN